MEEENNNEETLPQDNVSGDTVTNENKYFISIKGTIPKDIIDRKRNNPQQ